MSEAVQNNGRWSVAIAASLFLLAWSGIALVHPPLFGPLANGIAAVGPLVLLAGLLPLFVSLGLWLASTKRRGAGDFQAPIFRGRTAMLAFIISEVAFFAAFFAAYLQFAIFPGIAGLSSWPPFAMRPDDPWGGPLLNTVILLASGGCVAFAHDALLKDRWQPTALALSIAIVLGVVFIGLQIREFSLATQGFRDGVYPSIFFLTTGFHGLHVMIGAMLLSTYLWRVVRMRDASEVGFIATAAGWYWHFVDAVWLLLFAVFYAWAG